MVLILVLKFFFFFWGGGGGVVWLTLEGFCSFDDFFSDCQRSYTEALGFYVFWLRSFLQLRTYSDILSVV